MFGTVVSEAEGCILSADILGVDILGVDILGVDILGVNILGVDNLEERENVVYTHPEYQIDHLSSNETKTASNRTN